MLPGSPEWHAERRTGVGSSDCAAVLGMSPWKSALGVFAEKVWGVEVEESEQMRIGTLMEPVVAALYERRVGHELAVPPAALRNPDRPHMLANLDRVRAGGDERIVELKTAARFDNWGPTLSDDVPTHYYLQVQHQLGVRPAEVADLAALIGGNEFRWYEIRMVPEIVERIVRTEADFWGLVQARIQPAADFAHETTVELLNLLNVPVADQRMALPPPLAESVAAYERLGKEMAAIGRQRDELKAAVIAAMGACSVASLPDGRIVRRKAVRVAGYEVKPREQIEFRIMRDK